MKLSAPVYQLKSKAKKRKKQEGLSLNEALNLVAQEEGFNTWSLLMAKSEAFRPKSRKEILGYLNPGDLVLIAARPFQGKTVLTLEVLLQAVREHRSCYFFTLEYTHRAVMTKLCELDESFELNDSSLKLDFSDDISAEYIINQTQDSIQDNSLIAVDYLQLLDQKRKHPELQIQIEHLKEYAKKKTCILLFISQVNRAFEADEKTVPGIEDIHLPNPLDLRLFNKILFLHQGNVHFAKPAVFGLE